MAVNTHRGLSASIIVGTHYETVVEDAGVKTPTLNDSGKKPVRTTRSAKLNYKE